VKDFENRLKFDSYSKNVWLPFRNMVYLESRFSRIIASGVIGTRHNIL